MSFFTQPVRLLLLAVFVGVAALYVASTYTYPAPTCDETGYAASAAALLERGSVDWAALLPEGDPFGRAVNMATHGRLYAAVLAGAFALFGQSLVVARLVSAAGWALAAYLTYLVGARVYGARVGVAAALLFATTTKSLLTAHLVRPETWLAAAALAATLALLKLTEADTRSGWKAFAFGVFAVVPAEVHGNGFAFTAAFGVVLAIAWLPRRKFVELAAAGAGAAAALGLWAALRFAGAAAGGGFEQLAFYTTFAAGGASTGLLVRAAEIVEWLRLAFWVAGGPISLLELGFALLGLAVVFTRGSSPARRLALVAVVSLLAFFALYSQRFINYAELWSSFWFLLGSGAICNIAQRRARTSGKRAFAAIIAAVLIVQLAGDAWLLVRFRGGEYGQTFAQMDAAVPRGARVLADMTWWWTLAEARTFLADEYLWLLGQLDDPNVTDYLGLESRPPQAEAARVLLTRLQPDYIVLDRATGCNQEPGVEWQLLAQYAAAQCVQVRQVYGAFVGDEGKRTSQFAQVSTIYQCSGG